MLDLDGEGARCLVNGDVKQNGVGRFEQCRRWSTVVRGTTGSDGEQLEGRQCGSSRRRRMTSLLLVFKFDDASVRSLIDLW